MKIDYLGDASEEDLSLLEIPYFLNTVRVGWPSPADDYVERPIDLNEYCSRLGKGMSYIAQKVIYELNPLLIDYFHIKNEGFLGLSEDNGEYICRRALKQNMAIVSVKFGSPRYMRTVMSKRYSLSDKIGTLGGTLSLFTGMSFLSVFELAFWLIKLFVQMTLPKKRFKVSFLM